MVSLVVLSNTFVELTLNALRARLDEIFPGQFLPPRERGSFVVEGPVPGVQFLVQSGIAGASGMFMFQSVPGPYTDFSDFADHIEDAPLCELAKSQKFWLSIDLIHSTATETEAHRFIGMTLAELAPADAAVLIHPERFFAIRFNVDVRRQLVNGGQFN